MFSIAAVTNGRKLSSLKHSYYNSLHLIISQFLKAKGQPRSHWAAFFPEGSVSLPFPAFFVVVVRGYTCRLYRKIHVTGVCCTDYFVTQVLSLEPNRKIFPDSWFLLSSVKPAG